MSTSPGHSAYSMSMPRMILYARFNTYSYYLIIHKAQIVSGFKIFGMGGDGTDLSINLISKSYHMA